MINQQKCAIKLLTYYNTISYLTGNLVYNSGPIIALETSSLLALSQRWSNALDRGRDIRLIALDIKGAYHLTRFGTMVPALTELNAGKQLLAAS